MIRDPVEAKQVFASSVARLRLSKLLTVTLADPRRQGPLYAEARGYLQASVDFYVQAVRAADSFGATTGDLLSSVGSCLSR